MSETTTDLPLDELRRKREQHREMARLALGASDLNAFAKDIGIARDYDAAINRLTSASAVVESASD